jgi:DNA-directed RNA polymerase subunit RPC12/RpoP
MSVLLDHPALKAMEMVTEFACQACGSPAVVYPDRMSDDAPVKCQRCRTVLCTLREFRLSAEQGMAAIQAYTGGSDQTHTRSGWRLLDRLFRRPASP